jgi:isopenicillin N synthase-like dioxygenase
MNIPIIDYQDPEVRAKFVKSIRETGFAVLKNTIIPTEVIREVYSDFKSFFANEDAKKALMFDPATQVGYFPLKSEKAKDAKVQDLKEFFHYYPNGKAQSNPSGWPMDELCFALEDLGIEILGWLQRAYCDETGKSMGGSWGGHVGNSKNTLFRVLHYPPLEGYDEAEAVRSAAHEDINFITLLPAAIQSGLQVKDRDGNWHSVATDSNCIVVNIGDMLQLLTEGFYPSTTHRVVNPQSHNENVSRYSMPLFIHPHPETQLSTDKTAQQYLEERLKELGLK